MESADTDAQSLGTPVEGEWQVQVREAPGALSQVCHQLTAIQCQVFKNNRTWEHELSV